jgi:hypothetical protein
VKVEPAAARSLNRPDLFAPGVANDVCGLVVNVFGHFRAYRTF